MAETRAKKAKRMTSSVFGSNSEIKKAYYKHAVQYGDYVDIRIYKDVRVIFNGIDTSSYRQKEGEKRDDSLSRSKVKLFRLVMGNVGKHGKYRPIFATYTFKEPITNLDAALERLRSYRNKLNYYLGYKARYVAVPQIQWERYEKEGVKVWHFHIVFFNVPKLDFETNDKMWGEESNSVNLQFVRGIRSVGAYIAGYMTKKDFLEIPFNRRFYYASGNLVQPIDIYEQSAIDSLLENANIQLLSSFEGDNYSQTKYKIPWLNPNHSEHPSLSALLPSVDYQTFRFPALMCHSST